MNILVMLDWQNYYFGYTDKQGIKGALLQAWKSANIFVFIWK